MSKVQVAVRCRPFNAREKKKNSHCVLKMQGPQTISINPNNGQKKTFTFDHSFWTFNKDDANWSGQEDVFNAIGKGVIDNSFEGYNACIFAYGQTGSGKTYTMMGAKSEPGVIPRLCTALYDRINENADENLKFKVEVSYMEIYNEKVKDLLSIKTSKKPLRVREHKVMGPYVEGLTKLAVTSYDAIETLMTEGNKIRHTAATAMNDQSSRSHAVFTLMFTQAMYDPATKQTGEKVSRLCLVDLAGSERQEKTGASGDRLKEGSNINKSLTTLGLVISALAEQAGGKGKQQHIPYRNSTLTWLLKDNLGGNSKTIMMAALSPASDNYDETMSTLRYADRAKQIVNNAVVNEDPNQRLIRELREELERLRHSVGGASGDVHSAEEAEALRQQLAETEGMLSEMTQSWEEKLRQSNQVIAQHKKLLDDVGADLSGEQGGLRLKSKLPHFVSISDEFDFDITIYSLKEGLTRIGTSEADVAQDIELNGDEIDDEHCIVEHKAEYDEDAGRLIEVVSIHPIADAIFINGEKVEEHTRLRQGMVVQFGKSQIFRFNHPTEAVRLKELRDQGLLPQDDDTGGKFMMPAQKRFEELQKKEEERIAAEEARIQGLLTAEQERIAAEEARIKAAEAAIAEQARLQAQGQAGLEEEAEKNRAMAAQIESDRLRLAQEAEEHKQKLRDEAAAKEVELQARLAAESELKAMQLKEQLSSEMELEKHRLEEERRESHENMAKELERMKALMEAKLKEEADRAAAIAAEKDAIAAEKEAALAKQAEFEKRMAAEVTMRMQIEEEAKAKEELAKIETAKLEAEKDSTAAVAKARLAAFEAKLKEEEEKNRKGFEEQKKMREKLIKDQEARLKASQQAQAQKKLESERRAEQARQDRMRKAQEDAANASTKDAEREKAILEKAKQDARAALAKGMQPRGAAEKKLVGSFDSLNLKQATPKRDRGEMFKKSSTSSIPIGSMASGTAGTSNNPFAVPPAPIPASNPFALPPATGPPPAIPSRGTGAGDFAFNVPPPGSVLTSAHSSGHPGAHKAVATPTVDAFKHSARAGIATDANKYFGTLASETPGAAQPSNSTSPFESPTATVAADNPFGTPPPSAQPAFSGSARRPSKEDFLASQPADPYSKLGTGNSSGDLEDFDPDFDPTKWNGKGGAAPQFVSNLSQSSTTPPPATDAGEASVTGGMTAEERKEAFKREKIQQMMDLQREHMANRAAAAEAEKKMQERYAEEKKKKKGGSFFKRNK